MGMPSGQELLVILAIVVLLFGAKKIPELAKGIGKGIKNFKAEMKNDELDDAAEIKTAQSDTAKKVEPTGTATSTETPKTSHQA